MKWHDIQKNEGRRYELANRHMQELWASTELFFKAYRRLVLTSVINCVLRQQNCAMQHSTALSNDLRTRELERSNVSRWNGTFKMSECEVPPFHFYFAHFFCNLQSAVLISSILKNKILLTSTYDVLGTTGWCSILNQTQPLAGGETPLWAKRG